VRAGASSGSRLPERQKNGIFRSSPARIHGAEAISPAPPLLEAGTQSVAAARAHTEQHGEARIGDLKVTQGCYSAQTSLLSTEYVTVSRNNGVGRAWRTEAPLRRECSPWSVTPSSATATSNVPSGVTERNVPPSEGHAQTRDTFMTARLREVPRGSVNCRAQCQEVPRTQSRCGIHRTRALAWPALEHVVSL
jgi:hypothetical protein